MNSAEFFEEVKGKWINLKQHKRHHVFMPLKQKTNLLNGKRLYYVEGIEINFVTHRKHTTWYYINDVEWELSTNVPKYIDLFWS